MKRKAFVFSLLFVASLLLAFILSASDNLQAAPIINLSFKKNLWDKSCEYEPFILTLAEQKEAGTAADLQKGSKIIRLYGYGRSSAHKIFSSRSASTRISIYRKSDSDIVIKVHGGGSRNISRSKSAVYNGNLMQSVVSTSKRYIGVPYRWAGSSSAGFDCSGFVKYIYNKYGITLPRRADHQYYAGTSVARSNLQPGDLVFFTTYTSGPSHVGIYLGNSSFIHASSRRGVIISSLNDRYYSRCYIGARRY